MKGFEKGRSSKSAVRGRNQFSEAVASLRINNLLRKLTCVEPSDKVHIKIKGRVYTNYSSNDYLGLSKHPEIVKAAAVALKKYGVGSGSSRLLSGTFPSHAELEKRLAKFKKTDASLVFNTGYAANTGIIPVIAGKDTVIFSDELNHASIVDGTRLSNAEVKIYRHRDVNHLESLLRKSLNRTSVRGRLVITDTVFSMDGDIAPLTDQSFLCKKYGAVLMIDDAHSTGVLGKTGRGGLEHSGITGDRVIQMGTLSKAAGCFGAFVAGRRDLIDLLMSRARSFMYSTSLPPSVAAAGCKAVEIIERRSVSLRERLWDNRNRLYNGLISLGFNTLDSETPIIPIIAGDVNTALKLGRYLYEHRIFAPAIRPPTVSADMCRIRFSVTAVHTTEDIDNILECLKKFKS